MALSTKAAPQFKYFTSRNGKTPQEERSAEEPSFLTRGGNYPLLRLEESTLSNRIVPQFPRGRNRLVVQDGASRPACAIPQFRPAHCSSRSE